MLCVEYVAPLRLVLEHDRAAIFHGDSALLGSVLAENSVDAIVCDPPAAISFMGKTWDDDRGGFDQWTKWLAELFKPALRALKPGGFALVWALPRTSHWTTRALELAGFEVRDVHHDALPASELLDAFLDSLSPEQVGALARLAECGEAPPIFYAAFGSGFPKSLNISKAIDAHLGAERPVLGANPNSRPNMVPLTAPATAAASAASGIGTALKPAVEHWILARKPLVGTYAENWLKHGTGGLNVDACRIGKSATDDGRSCTNASGTVHAHAGIARDGEYTHAAGRWPAHFSLRHAADCEFVGEASDKRQVYETVGARDGDESTNFAMVPQTAVATVTTTREVYACAPGCPVAELDAQSGAKSGAHGRAPGKKRTAGVVYNNPIGVQGEIARSAGGASRFFYVAKGSRREKDAGLGHLEPRTGGEATDREDGSAGVLNPRAGAGRTGGARNFHPTVKAIALMRWLVRLVTPPGGIVLDMFAGSGSTGVAALAEGLSFVGVELTDEYLPILVGRVAHALGIPPPSGA